MGRTKPTTTATTATTHLRKQNNLPPDSSSPKTRRATSPLVLRNQHKAPLPEIPYALAELSVTYPTVQDPGLRAWMAHMVRGWTGTVETLTAIRLTNMLLQEENERLRQKLGGDVVETEEEDFDFEKLLMDLPPEVGGGEQFNDNPYRLVDPMVAELEAKMREVNKLFSVGCSP
jgi:hypothetical protein